MVINNCPICKRTSQQHNREEMDECYAKYLESLKAKLK